MNNKGLYELVPQAREQGGVVDDGFLSVDVEAQVRKIARRTLRSPAEHLVELVRDAARRGARTVRVGVSRGEAWIEDDGAPQREEELARLCVALDPAADPAARTGGLSFFGGPEGMGLLAAFATGPQRVEVEAAAPAGRVRAIFAQGARPRVERRAGGGRAGCSVRIARAGDPARERALLARACRFSPGRIVLDGAEIGGRGAPSDALADTRLASGDGLVWIPPCADVCRVRLLERGIVKREKVNPPDGGLVYEAAIECRDAEPAGRAGELREAARRLYGELGRRAGSLAGAARDRVEELLFLHFRRTGDASIVGELPLFRRLGGGAPASLASLRREAAAGRPVEAILAGEDRGQGTGGRRGGAVLVLTARQWEFLAEHAGVPLWRPPQPPREASRLARYLARLASRLREAWGRAAGGSAAPVAAADLDEGERLLVDLVSAELARGTRRLHGAPPGARVRAAAGEGSGPARLVEGEGGEWLLLLPRRGRAARLAARALARDPGLAGAATALLARGRYDT